MRISGYEKWFLQDLSLLNLSMNHFADQYLSFFTLFQHIWKKSIPHKVQVFSWIVALGKLPTCDMLQKKMAHLFTISELVCALSEKGDSKSLTYTLSRRE